MERVSRHMMFMEMAEVAAKRSTCFRGNIGALVVHGHDILSMGYNGPPSGEKHCEGNACALKDDGGCLRSKHAERNAIVRAETKTKGHLSQCVLYTTDAPCPDCAQAIFNSYLPTVFYRRPYRLRDGIEYLLKASSMIKIYRITPAGYIISERSGKLIAQA